MMSIYYELVHVRPTKPEVVIAIKYDAADLHRITEKLQWVGTWLTPTRKVLRHNRGILEIREKIKLPRVVNYEEQMIGGARWWKLNVQYHDELSYIYINGRLFMGHAKNQKVLWTSSSLSELADKLIGKEMAYQVGRYLDKYHDAQKGLG